MVVRCSAVLGDALWRTQNITFDPRFADYNKVVKEAKNDALIGEREAIHSQFHIPQCQQHSGQQK